MSRHLNDQPSRRRPRRLNRSLFVSLIVLVIFVGFAKLSRPLAALRHQQQALARLNLNKTALLRDNASLHRHQRHLATEAGQEQAAREKGYLRAGDRRLVFTREDAQKPRRPVDTEDPAEEPDSPD